MGADGCCDKRRGGDIDVADLILDGTDTGEHALLH